MIVTYYIKKRSDGGAMKEILVFFKIELSHCCIILDFLTLNYLRFIIIKILNLCFACFKPFESCNLG